MILKAFGVNRGRGASSSSWTIAGQPAPEADGQLGDEGRARAAARAENDGGPRVASIPISSGLAADVTQTRIEPDRRFRHPRVTGVPAVAKRLQLRAAATVLAHFGVRVIPWPLAERLLEWDAPFALADFCRDFGIDVVALLSPSSKTHEDAADRLRALCELLVAVEQTSVGSGLPLGPFLDVLRTDFERASGTLDSIAMLSQALRMSKDCKLDWQVFLDHRAEVLRRSVAWHQLSIQQIAELCEDCFAYRDIEAHYQSALARLAASLEDLERYDSTRDVAADFASTRDALQLDLANGIRDDPNEAIHAFEMLAQLAESAVDGEESVADESKEEDHVAWCLSVLGLSVDAPEDLAARTWRKLISQWHPDRHPPEGRAEAQQRTMEINEAYTALRRIWSKTQSS